MKELTFPPLSCRRNCNTVLDCCNYQSMVVFQLHLVSQHLSSILSYFDDATFYSSKILQTPKLLLTILRQVLTNYFFMKSKVDQKCPQIQIKLNPTHTIVPAFFHSLEISWLSTSWLHLSCLPVLCTCNILPAECFFLSNTKTLNLYSITNKGNYYKHLWLNLPV